MNYKQLLVRLENKIKERVPDFKIKFKNESLLMKLIGKLLFFNKGFMTEYTTTIGSTVYFPSKEEYEKRPQRYFNTLAHEYVHILDSKSMKYYNLKYLSPQILALLGLLGFIFKPFLIFFLLAAPIPAYWRSRIELKGYGMNLFLTKKLGKEIDEEDMEYYIDSFTDSSYYFMWPFKRCVRRELEKYLKEDFQSDNPAYSDVASLL